MLKEKLEPRKKKPLRRFHFSGNISTASSTKLNNGTNLSDVADSIILCFFYFIQERQDTPGKKIIKLLTTPNDYWNYRYTVYSVKTDTVTTVTTDFATCCREFVALRVKFRETVGL